MNTGVRHLRRTRFSVGLGPIGSTEKVFPSGSCHTTRRSIPTPRRPLQQGTLGHWSCAYVAVHVAAFVNPSGDADPRVGRVPAFLLETHMKSGRSLVDLAKEIERQVVTKKD